MPRSLLNNRERAGAAGAVLLVHAGLLALVLLSRGPNSILIDEDPMLVIETFDVVEPPPPPQPQQEVPEERSAREEGAASPPNIESKATPVVVPPPRVELPNPPPVVASETPAEGAEPTQGAAPVPGPGTGAGGVGTGTGSGGSGSGPGGGGISGQGSPPRLASRPLRSRDYPPQLRDMWPSGGVVMVAVRVQLDGRGTDCKINRSSGVPAIDAETCRLAMTRLRYRPARDEEGRPYVAWYGYMQYPVNF